MCKKESMEQQTEIVLAKDGNGSGSVRVECLGTQNRNPNLKPEPDPNFNSGENSYPKPNPRIPETQRLIRYPNSFTNKQQQYSSKEIEMQ